MHETLVLSPGGMTKILKQLEAKGLVVRRGDTADKRRNLVELTPRGQATIGTVQDAVREFDGALLERTLTDREQQRLAQLLRKLLVSLEPQRSAAAATAATARRVVAASRGLSVANRSPRE